MAQNTVHTAPYRRKGKTNYRKRFGLLKSRLPRLVVRRSNQYFVLQLTGYESSGDKVLASFHSKRLAAYGWAYSKKSVSAAYLSGYALGVLAKRRRIARAVLDTGDAVSKRGSRLYAALKGALDAGLDIPHDESILPDGKRVSGAHIKEHFGMQRPGESQQYAGYRRGSVDPSRIEDTFAKVKQALAGIGAERT
ncbi:50S ribosomal protein L18 [Candidatus Woesearchaeota archaeon]|nr:50S ribosomal protein L18 [Candidatus Woesearchaeota archaeon]